MDTQALKVSDHLSTVGVGKDDVIIFHFPPMATEDYLKETRDLFRRADGSKILPCEAIFVSGEVKMTVVKPIKTT